MIKIGDTLWRFDPNQRHYVSGQSAPVYAKHFDPHKVIGENRVSWLLERGQRAKKSDLIGGGSHWFTEAGMADDIWRHEHQYLIGKAVGARSVPVDVLRRVAELVGYKGQK